MISVQCESNILATALRWPISSYTVYRLDLPWAHDILLSDDVKFRGIHWTVNFKSKILSQLNKIWILCGALLKHVGGFASQMLWSVSGSTHLSIPESLGCRYFLDSSKPPPQAACKNCNEETVAFSIWYFTVVILNIKSWLKLELVTSISKLMCLFSLLHNNTSSINISSDSSRYCNSWFETC